MMKYLEMNIKSKTTHQKQATPNSPGSLLCFSDSFAPIVLLHYIFSDYRIPCSSMACATFIKPAMFAPLT